MVIKAFGLGMIKKAQIQRETLPDYIEFDDTKDSLVSCVLPVDSSGTEMPLACSTTDAINSLLPCGGFAAAAARAEFAPKTLEENPPTPPPNAPAFTGPVTPGSPP